MVRQRIEMYVTCGSYSSAQAREDPWTARAESIRALIQDLGTLGSHPVDLWPWRKTNTSVLAVISDSPAVSVLPPITFGRQFAHNLSQLRILLNQVLNEPYEMVKKRMARQTSLS
jgi:hypothetical protein